MNNELIGLVDSNISLLKPEILAALHDNIIYSYLEEGTSKIMGASREVDV
ncbi:MAG: hypothetical protein ABW170_19720 [Candidatus Thiodiazotropha sp. L084R]